MKKEYCLIKLFKQLIADSKSCKRLKKNGERVSDATISNYRYVLQNVEKFSEESKFYLRVREVSKLTRREYIAEKNYWKKFYKKYTTFLYKSGCHDNYVGSNIKIIRLLFSYIRSEKNINAGEFYKDFYVRKEDVDILVLSPDQLKFLIHDRDFEKELSTRQINIKDAFVFGCTTGLRFSDLFLLTPKNFEKYEGEWYLKLRSKKSKIYSFIKLPEYAVRIYEKHRKDSSRETVFTKTDLTNFNEIIKRIGEKAGWLNEINRSREVRGIAKKINYRKVKVRFCDHMSSHMMRRTAITTMLILGVPEHLVRKISGHSNGSKSFMRYVHFAQVYIDKELDKFHEKLENY